MIWQIIPTFCEFIAIFFTTLVCYVTAWMLTSNANTAIWMKLEMFDLRPFNCPICLNFWTTLFGFVILAYALNPFFLLWGTIAAGMTTYCVYDKWREKDDDTWKKYR